MELQLERYSHKSASYFLALQQKKRAQLENSEERVDTNTVKSKKLFEDKERALQKKVTDLNSQVARLERRITSVKSENENLKQKAEEQKPSEEKIKKLKKRNAELAAIARRLEEKAKQLQQENLKKTKERPGSSGSHDVDHAKKVFVRQRAKDLAEHAKNILAKDKEIETLRKKCQELQDELSNNNHDIYEDHKELEIIIKQAAKERLRLERQLQLNPDATKQNLAQQEANLKQLRALQQATQQAERFKEPHKYEIEATQKKIECETLYRQIEEQRKRYADVENELHNAVVKNTELTVQNADLERRINDLEKITQECQELRQNLAEVENKFHSANQQVISLQDKVESLEAVIQHMREAAEKRKQLENEHKEALAALQAKQQEVQMLNQAKEAIKKDREEAIDTLRAELRDLERKYELQVVRHDELSLEMMRLKQNKAPKPTSSIEIQTSIANGVDPSTISSPHLAKEINGMVVDRTSLQPMNESDTFVDMMGGDEELRDLANKIKALSVSDSEDNDDSFNVSNDPIKKSPKDMRRRLPDNSVDDPVSEGTQGRSTAGDTTLPHMPSLPLKSPYKVFVAKYSYDPMQFSPNENPDSELTLNAGDYVYIYGDIDEDGYYEGALMDGREGLVPSNFVEQIPDEDLEEFHNALAMGGKSDDSSLSIQHDLDFNSDDETEQAAPALPPDPIIQAPAPAVLDQTHHGDIAEVEEDNLATDRSSDITLSEIGGKNKGVPFPRNLKLERQLTNSILVGWQHPEDSTVDIQSYHIYVDQEFKTSVKGTERTKALVEGVDSMKSHRVCVRSVTSRGQSKDPECTIVIGKEASLCPEELTVTNVTATSAVVSWLPGNSNYQHIVLVNNNVVRTVKPGIYKCALFGLQPNSMYKATVRARNSKAPFDDDKNKKKQQMLSSDLMFRTQPAGYPDPPLDVQIEAGPQEGSMLVTWLPVTINTTGVTTSAVVTGYAVYIDDKLVKQLNSPTGDHLVMSAGEMPTSPPPQQLTVRTLTQDRESADSLPSFFPDDIIQEILSHAANVQAAADRKVPSNMFIDSSDSGVASLPENNEIFPPGATTITAKSPIRAPTVITPQSPGGAKPPEPKKPEINVKSLYDEMHDSSQSELSDIAEVEEDSVDTVEHVEMKDEDATPVVTPIHVPKQPIKKTFSQPQAEDKDLSQPQGKAAQPLAHSSPKHPRGSPTSVGKPSPTSPSAPTPHSQQAMPPQTLDMASPHHSHDKKVSDRKPPRGAESSTTPNRDGGSPRQPNRDGGSPRPPLHMQVPSIEITKDSSGSLSSPNVYSDDDFDSYSSDRTPSSKHSPASPSSEHFFNPLPLMDKQKHSNSRGNNNKNQTSHSRDKYARDMDTRDGYRDSRHGEPQKTHREGVIGSKEPHKDRKTPVQPYDHDDSYRLEDNEAITPKKIRDDISESELIDYEDEGESLEDMLDMEFDESQTRIFIALFDYDPKIMSPNTDGYDEELPFKEGQLIKIFGEKDPDGFYIGEAFGRRGYVPCNMVSEVQVDDPEIAQQLLKESNSLRQSSPRISRSPRNSGSAGRREHGYPNRRLPSQESRSSHNSTPPMIPAQNNAPGTLVVKRMIAMYDYDPSESSPNLDNEVELAFKTGDIILVFGDVDEDGFYNAELNGRQGLVPSNFLQIAPPSDEEYIIRADPVSPTLSRESSLNTSISQTPTMPPSHLKFGESTEKKSSEPKISSPVKDSDLDQKSSKSEQPSSQNLKRSLSLDAEDGKKKKGILAKSRNFLKKLAR